MAAKVVDFAAVPQTAIKVLSAPARFFREMPKIGGFVEPLVFMVIMGAVSGVLGGLSQAILHPAIPHLFSGDQMGWAAIILLPLIYGAGFAILGFIAAVILFVVWKLMGSGESYETAYRCSAYLSALVPITTVLKIIPYVGGAVGLTIFAYYLVTASVQVHGIAVQKAWLVFGILAAISIVFSVSTEIAARRYVRSIEQAAESWRGAADEMQEAAEEMQKQMEEEMEKHRKSLPPKE